MDVWLFVVDIEPGSGHLAGLQRRDQRLVVDDPRRGWR